MESCMKVYSHRGTLINVDDISSVSWYENLLYRYFSVKIVMKAGTIYELPIGHADNGDESYPPKKVMKIINDIEALMLAEIPQAT